MANTYSILPKTENDTFNVFNENKLEVDFLVFTRFENASLDYKFYFASKDDNLTEMTRKNFISQESHNELPYEAFFIYKNYCFLTIAELWRNSSGETRKDNVGRDISRKLFFVWDISKQPDWLKYEHLLVLLSNLQEVTKNYVDIVPNENKENAPTLHRFEFQKSDFDDGWSKISDGYETEYNLFLHSKLKELQLGIINIATPFSWTFDKQVLLLKGQNIKDIRYFIWHKILNRIPSKFEELLSQNRWIALDEHEVCLGLFNANNGLLIEKIDIEKENSKNRTETEKISNDNKEEVKIELETISNTFLEDADIVESIDFLKREICFFICSDVKFKPSILDAWNNSLNEIRVHYKNSSKKEKLQWVNRLEFNRQILEEEITIEPCDMIEYENYFSLLNKRLYELIDND